MTKNTLSPGTDHWIRYQADLGGVVQGVGFRPAFYRLAKKDGLRGYVQNRAGTLRLMLEGPESLVNDFMRKLPRRLPRIARLTALLEISREIIAEEDARPDFEILKSDVDDPLKVTIPVDLAICKECQDEVTDKNNRRYRYPFTTCTQCGPRYTVVTDLPYDRERTTLKEFPLCPECGREYVTPMDRRFHAESIACPVCGPGLKFLDAAGLPIKGDPLLLARRELAQGKIVAVRGIGGYLLAVDAFNQEAVMRLRKRKHRADKPFAVMAADLVTIEKYCRVSEVERELLESHRAPVVILKAPDAEEFITPLSPDSDTLGVMLPTSALHMLLFIPGDNDPVPPFQLLVMTSGNQSDEPTCVGNEEAVTRLNGIADFFLTHNREINLRNDDSVCVVRTGQPQVWRRARGYVPEPIWLKQKLKRRVLAMGSEVKNAIAVGMDREVVLSSHIGDLETPEALAELEKVVKYLPDFLQCKPEVVAVDLHPDWHSTRLGCQLAAAAGLPVVRVQHHYAHAASCMAEHGLNKSLALAHDGFGYGTDGSIWGAELLAVDLSGNAEPCRRLGTFEGVPLPGGDAAVRHPARQLIARWVSAGIALSPEWYERLGVTEEEANVWAQQCGSGLNTPICHSAGRVFDAFAALLGVAKGKTSYEGQAAIRLEKAAGIDCFSLLPSTVKFNPVEREGRLFIDWTPVFAELSDLRRVIGRENELAWEVHKAVAQAAFCQIKYGIAQTKIRSVVLSGGVFMNGLFSSYLRMLCDDAGIKLWIQQKVPPNDGGIALGQAVLGSLYSL